MRILPLLILSGAALASSGDRLDSFNTCVSGCLSSCTTSSVPLYLRILRWDCASECRYDCSHVLTDAADRGEEGYHQFFGKWAFTRMLGMQEPASVMFSIGNIIPHLRGFKQAQRLPHANGLRPWLMLAAAIQINTWIWSAVFHTRDMPWTERLDYFSATVTIGITLLYAIIRIFHLQTARTRSAPLWPVTALVTVVVLGHFAYVSSLDFFPYGYHVAFAATLGMLGNILWILWSVSFVWRPSIFGYSWPTPYPHPTRQNWTPAILVVLTIAAMALELLDFPPIGRVLDAHAAWHVATIPLAAAWWAFLIPDALEMEVKAKPLSKPE